MYDPPWSSVIHELFVPDTKSKHHPKCKGYWHQTPGEADEFDCAYGTTLNCEDCRYGTGKRDPESKCNQPKGRP